MVLRTDDPIHDFEVWDAEQNRQLDRLPYCEDCGNPIQQEDAVYINGDWLCDDCLSSYRREVLPE